MTYNGSMYPVCFYILKKKINTEEVNPSVLIISSYWFTMLETVTEIYIILKSFLSFITTDFRNWEVLGC